MTKVTSKLLNVKQVVMDKQLYPRMNVDRVTVARYYNALKAGATFPAIRVALIDGKYLLMDGAHRLEAHKGVKHQTIEAEVVENALGLYDIDLIRKTYLHNLHRPIKHFEVNKESFSFFKDKIIVERPTNAKRTWIAADFGAQAAPTEIIVIFEIETNDDKKLFKYIYNITLNNLIPDQQTEIFKYLVKELKADYVGIDRTELGGAQVLQDLNPLLPQERLIGVRFNEKILVGYEKDDNDILKIVDGKTIPIEEYVIDWAVEKTRELFYKQKIDCLYDMKLDKEFNAMVAVRQATRLKYSTLLANKQDHLHAAFLVFNIMRFLKEESLDNKIPTLTWGIGVVKTI